MLYDTYISLYNWYYGLPITTEETTQRVLEITDEGEVLGIGTINTTSTGEQIIPTLCMTQIIEETRSEAKEEEETRSESKEEETRIEEVPLAAQLPSARPSLAESLKTYMIETNYRLRNKKKKNNR
jgi:hypothetical protein